MFKRANSRFITLISILESVPKLRDGIIPSVLCLKHGELHFTVDLKILVPELAPQFRPEDFSEGEHQPMKQSSVTPPLADVFDAIADSPEGWLNGIDIEGQPLSGLQPVIQKGHGVLVKVRQIGFGPRILSRIQSCQQLFKSLASSMGQLANGLVLSGSNLFQSLPGQGKSRDLSEQLRKGPLLGLFETVVI